MQPADTTAKNLEEMYQKINSMAASLHAMESVVEGLVSHIRTQSVQGNSPDISKVLREELKNLNNKMEDMDVSCVCFEAWAWLMFIALCYGLLSRNHFR